MADRPMTSAEDSEASWVQADIKERFTPRQRTLTDSSGSADGGCETVIVGRTSSPTITASSGFLGKRYTSVPQQLSLLSVDKDATTTTATAATNTNTEGDALLALPRSNSNPTAHHNKTMSWSAPKGLCDQFQSSIGFSCRTNVCEQSTRPFLHNLI
jgi:hypothetical protein